MVCPGEPDYGTENSSKPHEYCKSPRSISQYPYLSCGCLIGVLVHVTFAIRKRLLAIMHACGHRWTWNSIRMFLRLQPTVISEFHKDITLEPKG